MKTAIFSGLALLMLSIESVLVKSLGFENTRIDVGLALVVFVGLRASAVSGATTSFMVGYLFDVFTGRPTGLFPFLAVLVFLIVRSAGRVVDGRARSSVVLFVAAATLVHALLAVLFTWLTSRNGEGHVYSLSGSPLQIVLTTIVGALLWPLLRKIEPGERPEPGVIR
jgi:rod shape-determining protein MreD